MVKPQRPEYGAGDQVVWARWLHDEVVDLTPESSELSDQQVLVWDATAGVWVADRVGVDLTTNILGSVADQASLPSSPAEGDAYVTDDTGHLWVYVNGVWQDAGQFTGDPGAEVELHTNATHIQWRYVGDATWTDLIALSELEGPKGLNWQGVWASGTDYTVDDAVEHDGSAWIAATDPAVGDEPGVAAAWETLASQGDTGPSGPEGLVWQGDWAAGTAYAADDAVAHAGGSWIANAATTAGEEPGVSAKWDQLAAPGQDGTGSPATSLSPSVDAASQAGAVGASSLFAREDHEHPSGGFAADTHNHDAAYVDEPAGIDTSTGLVAGDGVGGTELVGRETYASASGLIVVRERSLARDAEQNLRIWQLEADLVGATEGFTGWSGDAFLTNQDNVASVAGDITLSRAAVLAEGSVKLANMPAIGEPYMGGFFAGIIDTTQGNIITGDAYQTGERYALIVSPKSLEGGRDTGTGDLMWRTAQADVPEAKTRWDGLAAQRALASSTFPAFQYCAGLSYPSDGGSEWYLPALDELELIYRNLKPTTTDNYTTDRTGHDFPGGTQQQGDNPSSDPVGTPYTVGDPAQTTVAAFQDGGAEQLYTSYQWTATWYSSSYAWVQGGSNGYQATFSQTTTTGRVRPARRVAL